MKFDRLMVVLHSNFRGQAVTRHVVPWGSVKRAGVGPVSAHTASSKVVSFGGRGKTTGKSDSLGTVYTLASATNSDMCGISSYPSISVSFTFTSNLNPPLAIRYIWGFDPVAGSLKPSICNSKLKKRNFTSLAWSKDKAVLYAASTTGDLSVFNVSSAMLTASLPRDVVQRGIFSVKLNGATGDFILGCGDGDAPNLNDLSCAFLSLFALFSERFCPQVHVQWK